MNRHTSSLMPTKVIGWRQTLQQHLSSYPKLAVCYALIFGALGPLGFAPYNWWFCLIIAFVGLYGLLNLNQSKPLSGWLGFGFGLGYFGVGISWVYVSVASFGQVGVIGAGAVTFGLIALMAFYWGLAARGLYGLRDFPALSPWVSFVTLWLLAEWLRSTLFTGFPWLLPGYSIQQTPLFEWSVIGGIWFTSALALATAAILGELLLGHFRKRSCSLLAVLWLLPLAVPFSGWYQLSPSEPIQVTLVQGNVPQDQKWLSENASPTLSYYQQATINHLDSDLVVWPETAITYLLHQIEPYMEGFATELQQSNTTVITGVPTWDEGQQTYFNSVWALGNGFGLYNKQRLVPFGEYIPLSSWFGPVFDLFGMPMSQFSLGEANQPTLQVGELAIAPFVCYEIVYSELMRTMVRDSDVLLTISNDGWFGDSIGPWQHLQIAQFRAKEMGRYMIRATNTGITAVINENGEITAQVPQFVRTTLTSKVTPLMGTTPYVRWGQWPLLFLVVLFILAGLPIRNKQTS
jgi:apolipoprotein N-acyltransferase